LVRRFLLEALRPALPSLHPPGWLEWVPATKAERDAAWEAFKALTKAGWCSDGARGERDELHQR